MNDTASSAAESVRGSLASLSSVSARDAAIEALHRRAREIETLFGGSRCVLYTAPHTTPFARWTPILKDFARRISPPAPRFQSPPWTPFNSASDAYELHPDIRSYGPSTLSGGGASVDVSSTSGGGGGGGGAGAGGAEGGFAFGGKSAKGGGGGGGGDFGDGGGDGAASFARSVETAVSDFDVNNAHHLSRAETTIALAEHVRETLSKHAKHWAKARYVSRRSPYDRVGAARADP